ncbi:MAG: hypothetical protein R2722_07120 [Tessaracoccus sp.]
MIEAHDLGREFLDAQTRFFESNGWIMRGGSVIDATIIKAPSSAKNVAGARDPQMHQTAGEPVVLGTSAHRRRRRNGYVHTVTVTAANAGDITQAANLMRPDDEVRYADSGYQGVHKRPGITGDPDLAKIQWRVAARKSMLKAMPAFDQHLESRKASVRASRTPVPDRQTADRFTKTRYRGLAKNSNLQLHVLFSGANLLMHASGRITEVPGR